MKIKSIANVYLLLALVLGALVPVMLKIASQEINIYEYLMLTSFVAVPVSLAFLLVRGKSKRLLESISNYKEFLFIAFLGLLNYGMIEFGLTYAERYISASLATVVYRSFPLLMLLFLPVMLREKISRYQIIALMLAFGGIYIAVTGGSLSLLSGANLPVIALVVAIAVSSAFVSVAVKKYSFDMEIAIFVFSIATSVFFALLFIAVKAPLQTLDLGALSAVLYVGIVYNVFVGLMYYGALRMIKTTIVTNMYFLSPFITFIFSWIILGERIYLYYIAIAVLVTAGLVIQKFDKKGGMYMSRAGGRHAIHDVTGAFVNTDAPLIYNAIRSGGRVLAVKLDRECSGAANSLKNRFNNGKNAVHVYLDSEKKLISKEEGLFVREIMGVNEDEIVMMSAGNPEEGDRALAGIADSLG